MSDLSHSISKSRSSSPNPEPQAQPAAAKKRKVSVVYSAPKRVKSSPEEIAVEKAILDFMNRVQEKFGMRIEDYLKQIVALLPPVTKKEIDPSLLAQALNVCRIIADGLNAKNTDPEWHTTKEAIMQNLTQDLEMSTKDSLKYIISFFEQCHKVMPLTIENHNNDDQCTANEEYGAFITSSYDEMVDLQNLILNKPDKIRYKPESSHLVYIPPQIKDWANLQTLSLPRNKVRYFPPQVSQMKALTKLSLKYNSIETLPKNITKFPNLKKLVLEENSLTDLPSEILDLKKLESLIISVNKFQHFPVILFKMTSLRELKIGGHNFTSLPTEIEQLVNLETLDLSVNNLTDLPDALLKLEKLRLLILEGMPWLTWSPLLQTLHDRGCEIMGVEPDDVAKK